MRHHLLTLAVVAIFASGAEEVAAQAMNPTLRAVPERPLIEQQRSAQGVNFDIEIRNPLDVPIEVVRVQATVRDAEGALIQRKELNLNGVAPSILTVPVRSIAPGKAIVLFNPWPTFEADIDVSKIDFDIDFSAADGRTWTSEMSVAPMAYRTKTAFTFPLEQRALIWDGHDFYSHHRRLDFHHELLEPFGWTTNSSRYALDIVVIDDRGEMSSGGEAAANYFGYGQTVLAPAEGQVVKVVNDSPEGAAIDLPAVGQDVSLVLGNQVVIDHGNGEFSHLGHLLPGSVSVQVGDQVSQGQPIAKVGTSGWSIMPHLHFEVTTSPDMREEGVPAQFTNIGLVRGQCLKVLPLAAVDTGDVIDTLARITPCDGPQ